MKKYILALDQGTTSSKAFLFDRNGNIVGSAGREFAQIFPQPGWVEHDPLEIWSSQLAVAVEVIGKVGATEDDVAAIGITNQRETTIIWDKKTGKPVYNAIVWQCRRTAPIIEKMRKDGMEEHIRKTTGLLPDAYFSASKVYWILENVPGVRERAEAGELLFGTVDSWLIWKLTGGKVHVTDYTNASRTMLYDIHNLCWDKTILEYFRIPECMLPEVKPSSCIYGYTAPGVIGADIPIGGAAGDQQCALFGECGFEKGDVKNTYGTGCFLLMNTGEQAVDSKNGLLTTIAASADGKTRYALEGSIFVAGAVVQWLRDEMRMIKSAAQCEDYCHAVPDTNGVYFVPAFTGLGAPYWDQYARGCVVGITRGCSKDHFIRAAVESIAYQTHDILRVMEQDAGVDLRALKVDGGATANDFLMQFQADILNLDVLRPECIETTALGAAYLAGIAVGYWKNTEEIASNWKLNRTFKPTMPEDKRIERIRGWEKAVRQSFGWAEA